MSEISPETPQDSDGNGSAKSILHNAQVFRLFMSAIDERVGTRLRERYERNRNWLGPVDIHAIAKHGLTP